MTKINYESDFELPIILSENIQGKDFRIEFTTDKQAIYCASCINGEYSTNIRKGEKENLYYVVFRNHRLGVGLLKAKVFSSHTYEFSPDGKMQEVVPLFNLNIELWVRATDSEDIPTIEISNKDSLARLQDELEQKQDQLKSGENIKTINGQSILGNGNISIQGANGSAYDDTEIRNLIVDTRTTLSNRINLLTEKTNTIESQINEAERNIVGLSDGVVVIYENLTNQLDDRPTKNEVDKAIKNAITNTLNTGV